MVRATSSLPVPLSPVISTDAVLGATISISRKTSCMRLDGPTSEPKTPISRNLRRLASSSRSVPRRREAFCRMLRSRVGLTGFSMKSKAPRFMAVTAASTLPCAVSRMTATCCGWAAICSSNCMPIHARHAQVGDDDAGIPGLDRLQAFDAVGGGFRVVAPGPDQFRQAGPSRSLRLQQSKLFLAP